MIIPDHTADIEAIGVDNEHDVRLVLQWVHGVHLLLGLSAHSRRRTQIRWRFIRDDAGHTNVVAELGHPRVDFADLHGLYWHVGPHAVARMWLDVTADDRLALCVALAPCWGAAPPARLLVDTMCLVERERTARHATQLGRFRTDDRTDTALTDADVVGARALQPVGTMGDFLLEIDAAFRLAVARVAALLLDAGVVVDDWTAESTEQTLLLSVRVPLRADIIDYADLHRIQFEQPLGVLGIWVEPEAGGRKSVWLRFLLADACADSAVLYRRRIISMARTTTGVPAGTGCKRRAAPADGGSPSAKRARV